MPQVNALIAAPRLKKGSAGATSNAATTGPALPARVVRLSTDPLQGLKDRLYNWGRSCRAAMPDLDCSPPPIYDYIYQTAGKGKGKTKQQEAAEEESGTTSDSDDGPDPINEADAGLIDAALWVMGCRGGLSEDFGAGRVHYLVIKRHYYNQRNQPRALLDEALRALGDILA